MLIYGTRLWFRPEVGLDGPLSVVARWLSRKVGKQLTPGPFKEGIERAFSGGHQVQSVASTSIFPTVTAIAYAHPDSATSGRQWVTEIGFRQASPDADVECTVLLSTKEISARVSGTVQASRPGLVTELVRRCAISSRTQGTRILELAEEDAEAFRHVVFDERRTHSLVVLSADRAGIFLADAKQLSGLLLGLADIVVIPKDADTFWLARVVGREYVPYGGAARLVYPPIRNLGQTVVPTRLLTLNDAASMRQAGVEPLEELFSLVLHRSNLPLSWAHISLQHARDLKLKRELEERRLAALESGDQREYVEFLEQYVANLEVERKGQAADVERLERLAEAQEDRERALHFDIEHLKHRLAEATKGGKDRDDEPENAELIAATVLAAVEQEPSPEQCLILIEHLYPTRVVVLPDAWQSARRASPFKYGCKLYRLLNLLATRYWSALVSGKPDSEARKVFGAAFAATESDRVAGNDGARNRRTFQYGGTEVEMMKHLKIGVKPSASETVRVHFEWFADEHRIVIGHCGEHIPFR